MSDQENRSRNLELQILRGSVAMDCKINLVKIQNSNFDS